MLKRLMRVMSGLVLLALALPVNHLAFAAPPLPPVDLFQLPWELGKAWVAYDGFDNGLRRQAGSPHNFNNGGAVDFAPHPNMQKGEDTSNAWVTAAAAGTVVAISSCHLILAHADGWVTQYQHLANFQVKLGDAVARNQRLATIANASTQPVCLGSVDRDTPHLHFSLRPNMVGATFAGWEFKYTSLFNLTTFSKNGENLGLFKPLLNVMDSSSTPTPASTSTASTGAPTSTPTAQTPLPTATTPSGPYVSTSVNPSTIQIGETALVSVSLNNVPPEGFTSAEFTCTYDPALIEVSNIVFANLFGADPATVISGPQNGSFIVGIAGSKGNKAATSGVVFTFNARGLQAGQIGLGCTARVSQGSGTLTDLPAVGTSLVIVGISPTATPSPPPTSTPTPFTPPTSTFTPPVAESPTPSLISVPVGSPTSTLAPVFSPTATSSPLAVLTGQLFASKVVTVRVYDLNQNFIASVNVNPDGTFRFDLPPGTYTLVATANGFLRIEGTVALAAGETRAMPLVSLLAGDIDDDGSIDQFDAMTIGFSYGTIEPPGADLNSDGVINVFDLELLAKNFRKTGPVPWE
ncbi:MAG: peptidoglycan DD-metalloendopeptidase family protein [Anaerolineales bacterium]|nr:peptidoglycan DD-metalloendopeptidase family protein [Anaerolineales bacterium]